MFRQAATDNTTTDPPWAHRDRHCLHEENGRRHGLQNRLFLGQSETMADRESSQAPEGSERCRQSWERGLRSARANLS